MDYSYDEIMAYVDLYFTTGVRWVCMGLAVLVLLHQFFALLKMRNPSEIWAYLHCPDGSSVPLTHWENLVGRHRGCDIILNLKSVSRSHGTLIRDSAGVWEYNDLNSKNGSFINGQKVTEPTVMKSGDVLTVGGCDFELYPLSLRERMEHIEKRKMNTKRTSPWLSMLAITVFQILTVMQFRISLGDEFPAQLPFAFALLCILMWVYVIALRMMKRTGFEVEIIAFFLSTLSLALTASAYPGSVMKQSFCVVLGVIFFFAMCWLLRDLNRAKKLIYIFMAISVVLLILNLALGTAKFGSTNWIEIGGFSFQPSELVKIVFIFVGAASLDELQQRRNLLIFLGFSAFCLCCLAVMGDFGTAIVFFATFLIISFLRSGDFTKMFLVLGGAALMGLMVLRFKPYVADRFEIWRHVWDDPTGAGYQQVQTMTSIASGGLPGLGAGEGNLSDVGAASTDLVFGMLAEEWGLVIAILAVLCIITLSVFAYRSIIAGRSTYYCIAACATTTMFMFQTILNVFGSIDLLPLTGVTFPFVSSGGTSMIASWGMLAFLKAADTRQNASIAVRSKELHPEEDLYDESLSAAEYEDAQQFFDDLEHDTQYQDYIEPEPVPEPDPQDEFEDFFAAQSTYKSYEDQEPVVPQRSAKAARRGTLLTKSARREKPAPKIETYDEPVEEPTPRIHINVAPEPVWDRPEVPQSETPSRREFARRDIAPPMRASDYYEPPKPAKPAHPKAVKYTEVSDDDFFGKFGNDFAPKESSRVEETPVTLDDIFGDDGIFGGDKK